MQKLQQIIKVIKALPKLPNGKTRTKFFSEQNSLIYGFQGGISNPVCLAFTRDYNKMFLCLIIPLKFGTRAFAYQPDEIIANL